MNKEQNQMERFDWSDIGYVAEAEDRGPVVEWTVWHAPENGASSDLTDDRKYITGNVNNDGQSMREEFGPKQFLWCPDWKSAQREPQLLQRIYETSAWYFTQSGDSTAQAAIESGALPKPHRHDDSRAEPIPG